VLGQLGIGSFRHAALLSPQVSVAPRKSSQVLLLLACPSQVCPTPLHVSLSFPTAHVHTPSPVLTPSPLSTNTHTYSNPHTRLHLPSAHSHLQPVEALEGEHIVSISAGSNHSTAVNSAGLVSGLQV
jgi:hypothetical protein